MKALKLVAGIDVSKDTLDVHFNDAGGGEHCACVSNDTKGHAVLLEKVGRQHTYVMESSGPYYLHLAFFLKKHGVSLRVENPLRIRRFIQMNLERHKTDPKDARWIYRYGQAIEGKPWQLPSRVHLECQSLVSVIELYKRQLVMLKNQQHSLQRLPLVGRPSLTSLQQTEQHLQVQLKKLEQALEKRLLKWQAAQWQNLQTIPGLGKRAIALLIIYTDGFTKILNHRQLTALAGLSPREFSSGTSVRGKKGICKMGSGRLRSVLYMCALSALRCNKACQALFERLKAKGKNGKLAVIAVCNKLLKQAFAIATKAIPYQENYKSTLEIN
jgi:transposase